MEAGEGVFSPKDRCYIYRHGMEYPVRIKGVGGGGGSILFKWWNLGYIFLFFVYFNLFYNQGEA